MAKKDKPEEDKVEEQKNDATLEEDHHLADSPADVSEVDVNETPEETEQEDLAKDEVSDIPDHIAVEDGAVVSKGAVYKLSPKHPTGSYWRNGIHFTAGVEVTVDDSQWGAEQVEEMVNDPWLECVQIIPMTKEEYAKLKKKGGK